MPTYKINANNFGLREYFINRNPQPKGEHEIHVGGCSNPPNPANAIPLGAHSSCSAAKQATRRAYPNWEIDGCYHCLRECHTR